MSLREKIIVSMRTLYHLTITIHQCSRLGYLA